MAFNLKSKQNNDERLEFLSLRMIEADSLRQINFKDLIKDVANKKCRRTFFRALRIKNALFKHYKQKY
jgi:phosphopantetheine adenylyltransferase